MGIKNIFALQKATRYSFPFVQPSLDAGNSLKWLLGIFQDGGPLTHSQVLSTFQDGGRVKFPTLGTVVDVKIPTHVRFTTSNSRGLPGPPILGQTIDRCTLNWKSAFSLHRSFGGKSSWARIWSHLLCLCVICMGNCSWFTDGKLWFTDDE